MTTIDEQGIHLKDKMRYSSFLIALRHCPFKVVQKVGLAA